MLRHLLILPDGTEIFSGAAGAAISNVRLTRSVNDGEQLSPGAVCAGMLEATLLDVDSVRAGDAVTLYTVDDDGQRRQEGIFLAQQPERRGARRVQLTAYDRLILLDRDLTEWLAQLSGWPYPLQTFAGMVCSACGLRLLPGEMPNMSFPVDRFTVQGVTGRQLMMWVGQLGCRFCRVTAQGDVELAWYTPETLRAGPSALPMSQADYEAEALQLTVRDGDFADGALTAPSVQLRHDGQDGGILTLGGLYRQYCLQGSTSLADYTVAPIEKVQLRRDEQDVGAVWPSNDPEERNTYCLNGNPLITARSAQALEAAAHGLYTALQSIVYTPGTIRLPAQPSILPGSILQLTDPAGKDHTFYVMTTELSGQTQTLTGTGQPLRDSTTAFNQATYAPLSGKVLRLRTDVDGILAENVDTAGRMSRLEMDLGGIRGMVQTQQNQADTLRTQLTTLEQTAQSVSATVRDITEKGATRLESQFGLTIDGSAVEIHRSDSDMVNRLDEKGMYILRDAGTAAQTTMLRADAEGVLATDVSVRNFLRIGDHARFEDYTDGADTRRIACFFIGG